MPKQTTIQKKAPPIFENQSGLHQFSMLVNAATACAGLTQKISGTELFPNWAKTAQKLSTTLASFEGQPVVLPHSVSSAQYREMSQSRPAVETHPLMVAHTAFDALLAEVSALSPEAIERAAQVIASSLAIPFERDGVPHLVFPQHGKGFKVRTRKDGTTEFSEWRSGWSENARRVLPPNSYFNNSGMTHELDWARIDPDETAALNALKAQWGSASTMSMFNSNFLPGDIPTDGTYLGGKLPATASSETGIVRAGTADFTGSTPSMTSSLPKQAHLHALDPFVRRLSWTAIALTLGDQINAADAASSYGSPLACAVSAFSMERAVVAEPGTIPKPQLFPGIARSHRPALCTMQTATTLVGSKQRYGYYGAEQWAYNFGFLAQSGSLELYTKGAADLIEALDTASLKISTRARALASLVETEWLEKHHMAPAFELARVLAGGKEVSVKAINWALANPQTGLSILRAKDNPILGLAAKSVRYLGTTPPNDDESISRARAGWSGLGLEQAGFDGVAIAPTCSSALLNLAGAELTEKLPHARLLAREKTKLAARALQSAFAEGATEPQALAFLHFCQLYENRFIDTQPPAQRGNITRWIDRLHPDVSPTSVQTVEQARDLAIRARARRAAYPSAMRAMFRAFTFGEGMPENSRNETPEVMQFRVTYKWLLEVTAGEKELPAIDWEAGIEGAWFKDLAQRVSGSMAQAARQAQTEGGRHGALAARAAVALGIRDVRDGNDLIGKVREALKTQHGMGESGWKAVAQISPSMFESLCARLESLAPEALSDLAHAEKSRENYSKNTQKQTGLAFTLLSNSALFAYPLDTAEAVDLIAMRRHDSELLCHGMRPITVSSAEQAEFAELEARAKAERLPRIVKSMGERIARLTADHLKIQPQDDMKDVKDAVLVLLENDIGLIDDWLRNSENGVWQTLPTKCSFADLMRRQVVWHEDTVARAIDSAVNGKVSPAWGCSMPRAESESWSAVLIGSAAELIEEGRSMNHCVSSYSDMCKSGTSRIFSVRLNGQRVSTLELRLYGADGHHKAYRHHLSQRGESWKITENKGNCNAKVSDPSALAFAAEVERKMNTAHLAWCLALETKRSELSTKAALTRKTARIKLG